MFYAESLYFPPLSVYRLCVRDIMHLQPVTVSVILEVKCRQQMVNRPFKTVRPI